MSLNPQSNNNSQTNTQRNVSSQEVLISLRKYLEENPEHKDLMIREANDIEKIIATNKEINPDSKDFSLIAYKGMPEFNKLKCIILYPFESYPTFPSMMKINNNDVLVIPASTNFSAYQEISKSIH